MRTRNDYVMVCLSAAGRQYAGKGETLRITSGRMHYLFVSDKPVEILRQSEWALLQKDQDASGHPLFEEFQPAPVVQPEKREEA